MSRTSLAAAVVVVALLGACSDDDPKPDIPDPTPSAPSTSATVSTPTTSPTVSRSPRETVDAWLSAWTVAMQTGDTTDVVALSSSGCSSCQRLIQQVSDLYAKGGRLDTAGWTASRVGEAPDSIDATPSFVMQVQQAHRVLYDEDGAVVHETQRMQVPMRMTFAQMNAVWVLARLEILE